MGVGDIGVMGRGVIEDRKQNVVSKSLYIANQFCRGMVFGVVLESSRTRKYPRC